MLSAHALLYMYPFQHAANKSCSCIPLVSHSTTQTARSIFHQIDHNLSWTLLFFCYIHPFLFRLLLGNSYHIPAASCFSITPYLESRTLWCVPPSWLLFRLSHHTSFSLFTILHEYNSTNHFLSSTVN